MPRRTDTESRAAGDPSPIGRFRYSPLSNSWEWDEVTSHLHGLDGRRRTLSTDDLLGLVHPDDRDELVTSLAEQTSGRLRVRYRVQPPEDDARQLLIVGHAVAVHGTVQAEGHAVDLTADLRATREEAAREAVEAAMEGRGHIEQAKGALMLAYGLDEDQAFALLRWWSRNSNVRVRVLAERLMATAQDASYSHEELRSALDRVLHDLAIDPGAR